MDDECPQMMTAQQHQSLPPHQFTPLPPPFPPFITVHHSSLSLSSLPTTPSLSTSPLSSPSFTLSPFHHPLPCSILLDISRKKFQNTLNNTHHQNICFIILHVAMGITTPCIYYLSYSLCEMYILELTIPLLAIIFLRVGLSDI